MRSDRKSRSAGQSGSSADRTNGPLQSWKKIAAYLGRAERTARRWEKMAGLPVRRYHDGPRSSVYAYRSELDAWRAAQEPSAAISQTEGVSWRKLIPVAILLAAILVGGWIVFYSPIMNPPNALVEADGIILRQVWAEAGVDDSGDVSFDGRFLTFTDWSTGDLAIRDLDSEVSRRLTNKGSWEESNEYAFVSILSPDGKQIANAWFNRDRVYELRLLDLNESEPHVLFRCEEGEYIVPFGWLPEGKEILIAIRDSKQGKLALLSVSDQSLKPLVSTTFDDPNALGELKLALSPDGKHITTNEPKGAVGQRDIFIVPLSDFRGDTTWDSREWPYLIKHPADDYLATWPAGGRHVFFASDRTGSTGLWKVGVENGRPVGEPELIKDDIGPLRNLIRCTQEGELYFSLTAGMEDIFWCRNGPEKEARQNSYGYRSTAIKLPNWV